VGGFRADGEIPLPLSFFYLFHQVELGATPLSSIKGPSGPDLRERHCQVGSLAGAAHLLNNNAGVLRATHREQKSRVEQKGKSRLDFDFQCEYKP
jgi:hypothetical protein